MVMMFMFMEGTMRKAIVSLLVIAVLLSLSGCGCKHEYMVGTCVAPATCRKCGKTMGDALGHDWAEATCTTPVKCLQCGVTKGEPLGHKLRSNADCTNDAVCTTCGKIVEKALGHNWTDASCVTLKTCAVCGETEDGFAEHIYSDATCITPMTCVVCGATEGTESTEHSWTEATCTTPKTCSLCESTEGKPLGHKYSDATCTAPKICERCGETTGKAKGHKIGNWTVSIEAGKGKEGTRVRTCTVCKEVVETEQFSLTNKELLKQYKGSSSLQYDALARSPEKYKDTNVFFTGRVVQVCSEASSDKYYSTYRVATNGSYKNVVFLYIDNYGSGERILEDDIISFYGKFDGLYTYTTVMGASLTIPSIKVELYCQGKVS